MTRMIEMLCCDAVILPIYGTDWKLLKTVKTVGKEGDG